jgi:hypothetical protein
VHHEIPPAIARLTASGSQMSPTTS